MPYRQQVGGKMNAKELWICYNHAHNIIKVYSIKPDLNENIHSDVSDVCHVIEYAAFEELKKQADVLNQALKYVFKMIQDGQLVRDISNDHKSDWAILQMELMQSLEDGYCALSSYEKFKATK